MATNRCLMLYNSTQNEKYIKQYISNENLPLRFIPERYHKIVERINKKKQMKLSTKEQEDYYIIYPCRYYTSIDESVIASYVVSHMCFGYSKILLLERMHKKNDTIIKSFNKKLCQL